MGLAMAAVLVCVLILPLAAVVFDLFVPGRRDTDD
jgi:hypothetical protein